MMKIHHDFPFLVLPLYLTRKVPLEFSLLEACHPLCSHSIISSLFLTLFPTNDYVLTKTGGSLGPLVENETVEFSGLPDPPGYAAQIVVS